MSKKKKNIEEALEAKIKELLKKTEKYDYGETLEYRDDLLNTSLQHQQFYAIQAEKLISALNDIAEVGDKLSGAIAKNAVERYELDKSIFTAKLFK